MCSGSRSRARAPWVCASATRRGPSSWRVPPVRWCSSRAPTGHRRSSCSRGSGRPTTCGRSASPVGHELDGVGQNLQDHPYVVCIFESTAGGSLLDAEHPKYLAEYLLRKSGPLTSSVAEAFAFVRSRQGLPAADLQFHFAPAFFSRRGAETRDKHAYTTGPVW